MEFAWGPPYRLPMYPPEYFRAGQWNVLEQSITQSLNGLIRYGISDSLREIYD